MPRGKRADFPAPVEHFLCYLGHRCRDDDIIKPWYHLGALSLNEGDSFEIPSEGLVLGRGRNAGVRVASSGIARAHALVAFDENGVLNVRDLGSSSGTFVNGKPINTCVLNAGDVISLADRFDFRVVIEPQGRNAT